MKAVYGLILIGLAYLFATFAIDTGRWSLYAATIIALVTGSRLLFVSIFKRKHAD